MPVDLRVLWTLSVMVCYTAFLSCFTNEMDADLSVFDLQATLRGKKMDYASVQARERAAQVLVQAMSLSLFKSQTKIKVSSRGSVHRRLQTAVVAFRERRVRTLALSGGLADRCLLKMRFLARGIAKESKDSNSIDFVKDDFRLGIGLCNLRLRTRNCEQVVDE